MDVALGIFQDKNVGDQKWYRQGFLEITFMPIYPSHKVHTEFSPYFKASRYPVTETSNHHYMNRTHIEQKK